MIPGVPKTRKGDFVEVLHGIKLHDPYRWLEEESAERTAWVAEQNAYARSIIEGCPGREEFRSRLEELLLIDRVGAPKVREGRIFYSRQRKDQQHSVIYTREWPEGQERVLIDPNVLSEDGSVALFGASSSHDGSLLAYGLTTHGSDWARWRFMDIASGEHLEDEIPRLAYSGIHWLSDNTGFFYSRSEHTDPDKLTKTDKRVFFHPLGTDWRDDELVFGSGLKGHESPGVEKISKDGRHIILGVSRGWGDHELFYWDREGKPVSITPGEGANYDVDIKDDRMYVLTNKGAPRYRVCAVSLDGVPHRDRWETLVPEQEGAVLDDFSVLDNRLFVSELRDVSYRLKEYTPEGNFSAEIELPALGSVSVPYGRKEMDAIFLSFSSFFHPSTTYRYDLEKRTLEEFSKNEYSFDPDEFMAEQVWFRSKDDTDVPMFVIRKKEVAFDGSAPTILTGYGGFDHGITPSFSPTRIAWFERGGIVAVANLRGGDEFGEEWHKGGMRENKQNVFDDFICAGEALVGERPSRLAGEERYAPRSFTGRGKLGIQGGSNGGLLVGAALVQRPDLWSAVSCDVPLLDMLRFHFTEGGKYWVSEYGDPDDPNDFRFLLDYSPYHNVKAGVEYPPVIFETSLGDDRGVDPMHAMKMAARVQEMTSGEAPVMLLVREGTGHGHSKPMSMIIDELVDYYAFMDRSLR